MLMENEAYERARELDNGTILRQNQIIKDQLIEIEKLEDKISTLTEFVKNCVNCQGIYSKPPFS